MNASSANQSQGKKRGSAVQGDVLGNFVDTDEHYRDIKHRIGGSIKISKEKAATTSLNALQLTL